MAIERWLITLILLVSGGAWASSNDIEGCEAQLLLAYRVVSESYELPMFTPEDRKVQEHALNHLAEKYLTLKGIAYRKSDEFQFEILPGEQSKLNRLAKRLHKMNQLKLFFSPVGLVRAEARTWFSIVDNLIVLDLETVINDRVSSSLVHELRHYYAHVGSQGMPLLRDFVQSKGGALHMITRPPFDLYSYRQGFAMSEIYSYLGDARRELSGERSPQMIDRALYDLIITQAFAYTAEHVMRTARWENLLTLPLKWIHYGQHLYVQLPLRNEYGELLHLEFAVPPSFLSDVTYHKDLIEYVHRRIDRHLDMLENVQFHLQNAVDALQDNGDIETTRTHIRKVEERLIQDLRGN